MLTTAFIQVKSNVEVLLRERGKLVGRRETHNIFLGVGQAWLAQLLVGEVSTHIKYLGVGMGGSKQNNPIVDAAPLSAYPDVGAHSQSGTDPLVTSLERPVAFTSTGVPVTPGADTWLKQSALVEHPTGNQTRLTFVLSESDVSFGSFSVVPISELALFTSDKNPLIRVNWAVAYDTLAPIPKTSALELEIRWTAVI